MTSETQNLTSPKVAKVSINLPTEDNINASSLEFWGKALVFFQQCAQIVLIIIGTVSAGSVAGMKFFCTHWQAAKKTVKDWTEKFNILMDMIDEEKERRQQVAESAIRDGETAELKNDLDEAKMAKVTKALSAGEIAVHRGEAPSARFKKMGFAENAEDYERAIYQVANGYDSDENEERDWSAED